MSTPKSRYDPGHKCRHGHVLSGNKLLLLNPHVCGECKRQSADRLSRDRTLRMPEGRTDMIAPDIEQPINLSDSEQRAVYREFCLGGSESKLANYFNTTVTNIRRAVQKGKDKKWKK